MLLSLRVSAAKPCFFLGPGYDVEPTLTPVVKGMNAGKLLFEPMHGGYGAVVVVGQNYSLKGETRKSLDLIGGGMNVSQAVSEGGREWTCCNRFS